ncbi:MAG TPA: diguanylate cyclase [Desulfovibrio sp.]|uniref:diguanylate cyclase domain-containing protein n=1 Tax=Desulfovibrio sp. TaxID=885 RepID=UPI002D51AC1D|nr:diguanylate cyclase [Desulfovibrio sp.]HZF61487.1 diguanylate cyclase [Desulfovibrio sp.]
MKKKSIKTLIFLCFALTFFVAAALYIINTYNNEKIRSINEAKATAESIYILNSSILDRFMYTIRKKVLLLVQNNPEQIFDPDIMSSIYNLRSINNAYNDSGGEQYRIKLCTINSLNPLDEADVFESQKIQEFNADRSLKRFQGIRDMDGDPYYIIMCPFFPVASSCMQCHRTPETAPPGLVDLYGTPRGFGWSEGQIISAISIQVPLAPPLAAAHRNAQVSSLYFLGFLCVFLVLSGWLLSLLVLAPLQRARDIAKRIAADPTEHLGERIALPNSRELAEFADAFNNMSEALAQERSQLEVRVAERTSELAEANKKLKILSDVDGLTGLANRRKFDRVYQSAWQNACENALFVAVILLDVDKFKDLNDKYGHQVGDDCLRCIARILLQVTRSDHEFVARYGGEEFVVVLLGLEGHKAQAVALRIIEAVEKAAFPHDKAIAGSVATLSAGVAACRPLSEQNPEDLLKKADVALYKAKAEGRNRSVLSA